MFAGFRSMARRLDDMARDLRPGPLANDYQRLSSWGSAFPADAEAIVEPLPVAANQGGRRNRGWRVRFKARWAPTIDPLTGWTGGGDPLETIELRFPDRESAENRSEEHTSELLSLMRISTACICLKNKKTKQRNT